MRNQKNKIFKALIIFSLLLIIIVKSANYSTSIRIRLTDLTASSLNTLRAVLSAPKRLIPFASLREDNRILHNRVDLLTSKMEEMKTVSDENRRLRELLNFIKSLPYTTIPAQVIGRDPSNWSNSLIIDKGLIHGIRQNKAALSTKGLAGRVVEVGRYSSKILLITDPSSKVGVLIQKTRQGGILVGRPDGKCKMIYISLDSEVNPGDKVITAGFGSIFPKGILVGEVVKVDKEPGRLYKYAIVKPAQDLSKLEEVLCLK